MMVVVSHGYYRDRSPWQQWLATRCGKCGAPFVKSSLCRGFSTEGVCVFEWVFMGLAIGGQGKIHVS